MPSTRHFVVAVAAWTLLAAGLFTAVLDWTKPEETWVETPVLVAAELPAEPTTTVAEGPPEEAPPPAPGRSAPARPPKDPYAGEPIVELGSIEIPKIGLNHKMMQGISLRNIDRGPSHWPGTAMPGENGNIVIAGHRVTHSKPFRNIHELVPGDEVYFVVGGIRTRYLVTGHEIVAPTALYIVDQTPDATGTLFACHPPGSARQRYVVRLALDPVQPA